MCVRACVPSYNAPFEANVKTLQPWHVVKLRFISYEFPLLVQFYGSERFLGFIEVPFFISSASLIIEHYRITLERRSVLRYYLSQNGQIQFVS